MEAVKQIARNAETLAEAHRNFSRGDLEATVRNVAVDLVYMDHPRGITVRGRQEFIDWLRSWKDSFSDAEIASPTYTEAADHVIARFFGRGTNDGPAGPLPATGRRMDVAMCEVARFNSEGQMVSGEIFYDQMTILTQLGHVEPPESS